MALRLFEGFDGTLIGTLPAKIIAQTGIPGTVIGSSFGTYNVTTTGVYGLGKCLYLQGYNGDAHANIILDNQPTLYVCFHFNCANNVEFLQVRDSTTVQCYLQNDGTNHLQLKNTSGTVLATSSKIVFDGLWHYVEFAITINSSTGSSVCNVDGVQQWNVSSVNTRAGGSSNNYANNFYFYATTTNVNVYVDNLVIMDGTGSTFNAFQGEMRVAAVLPNAAGTYSNWTASAGSNYACVNQNAPGDDGDTTYVSSSTTSQLDSYNFTDVSAGSVLSVLATIIARKDDVSSRTISITARESGTDYVGSNVGTLTASYQPFTQRWDTNDPAGSAWTLSNFNSCEFGIKMVS